MKARIFILGGASAVALVVALAQTEVIPTASPAPAPTATDESRPTFVTTPTSDAEMNAAGQPLAPMRPEPDAMMEPEMQPAEQEAFGAEEAIAVDEMGHKRWRIIPLFSAGVEYNDNIFISNTDRVSDIIWTTSAGLIFELGDFREHKENYLGAQWIGQPVIYTENPAQNGFNQFASLVLRYRFSKLVVGLDSNYSIVKGPNREVNAITTTQRFWNSLAFNYDYSDKTQLNLTVAQTTSLTQDFEDTSQYEARAGVNYQLFPKTTVGFQGVIGVIDSSDTPLQYFQQARLQVSYSATQKLNFSFNGGVQFLEFEGSDVVRIDPVFSLGVHYQPFRATSLSLSGFRNVVGSSLDSGQDYFATGFELSVQQQFFQKIVAAVSFGYENDSYFGTTPDTPSNRVDNYVYVRPRLTYAFVDWFSASIFYEFRQTTSTQESSSFYNNRAGLEIVTKF